MTSVRRSQFTIMECIVACAIGSAALALGFHVLGDGWHMSVTTLQRAQVWDETTVLRERWRRFIHGTNPDTWRTNGRVFATGTKKLGFTGRFLMTDRGRADQLPPGTTLRFRIEQPDDSPPLAIMLLEWEEKTIGRHSRKCTVRLVATSSQEVTQ